jgi:hypothetical protein
VRVCRRLLEPVTSLESEMTIIVLRCTHGNLVQGLYGRRVCVYAGQRNRPLVLFHARQGWCSRRRGRGVSKTLRRGRQTGKALYEENPCKMEEALEAQCDVKVKQGSWSRQIVLGERVKEGLAQSMLRVSPGVDSKGAAI